MSGGCGGRRAGNSPGGRRGAQATPGIPTAAPSLTGFTMALLPARRRFELSPPIRVTSLAQPFPPSAQWKAAALRMRGKPSGLPYGFHERSVLIGGKRRRGGLSLKTSPAAGGGGL